MASGKIGFGEAFDGNFVKQMESLNKEFKTFLKTYKALIKESKDNKDLIKAAKSLNDINKAAKKSEESVKKLTLAEKEQARIIKATALATEKAAQATTKHGVALAKSKEELRRATAESKKLANAQLTGVKSTNKFGVAIKSFLFKANFMANIMASLASAVGRVFVRALRGAFEVVKDFGASTARLASIMGETKEGIKELTDQARKLGGATQFTATQVTSLQIELGKLGFVAAEIKKATPGILSFATATGTDLAEAAKIAGVAVRAFGLNAAETEDAVATLAVATTKSALSASDYLTVLSTLGPVAKAYGFTLSETVALTGKLKDAGFDATKAATATRNILLNLADANGALAKSLGGSVTNFDDLIDGLIQLDKEGVSLAETLELTDKRSVAAFNQFLNTAEGARELEGSISDVTDELQAMVDVQLNTLAADMDLLKSAWDELLISLGTTGPLRGVIQFLTNAVLQVSNLDLALRKFNKQTVDQLSSSFDLLTALTNKQGQHFNEMIAFFDKMSDEQLASRGIQQMAEDFALIRKVNLKEGKSLAEEYLRRREETTAEEVEMERLKNERIIEDETDQARKRGSIYEDVSKEILRLKADEIAGLKEEDQDYLESYKNIWLTIATTTEDALDEIQRQFELKREEDLAAQEAITLRQEQDAQREKDLAVEVRDAKIKAANDAFSIALMLTDRKIALLKNEADQGIISEKKYQTEVNKVKRQQAILDRAQAVFNIALNTAVAISKVSPVIPLMILVGVMGAALAAAVIAQPLPQFAKGTKSSPEGPAIVGEKGRELKVDPSGKMSLTPGKASLDYLKKGTKIVPADVTEQLLRYAAVANGFEGKADDQSIFQMMDELKGIKRAIMSKPVTSSTVTAGGILTATHKGNTTLLKRQRYYT